eukprot:382774-Rhodomonas_salina.1
MGARTSSVSSTDDAAFVSKVGMMRLLDMMIIPSERAVRLPVGRSDLPIQVPGYPAATHLSNPLRATVFRFVPGCNSRGRSVASF